MRMVWLERWVCRLNHKRQCYEQLGLGQEEAVTPAGREVEKKRD